MKPEDYANKEFVIEGIGGVELTSVEYLHPDYELPEVKSEVRTNQKGFLPVFRVNPRRSGLPSFVPRVGHDDQNAIDVDLVGDKAEQKAFATGAPGHLGHKTDRVSTDPPTYKIDIRVPSVGRVFVGTVTVRRADLGLRVGDRM